ncbi:type II toxin-antitoxin system RelE/ParE family toxin [Pseudoduganella sp. GCM10020061]|uniref:type II toxin-antitoxin system RelE/ParE family toxin n=1 Tax=Pseudoduganella sp. GCM10020061 TaxID=3317345 RepID=UPI003625F440
MTRVYRMKGGNFGDHRPIGDGVFELRIHAGPGYRIYYGQHGDELVLLLCGGSKKSQDSDIRIAKGYWREWRVRPK